MKPYISYRHLQFELKKAQESGILLQVKLNVSQAELEAECERLIELGILDANVMTGVLSINTRPFKITLENGEIYIIEADTEEEAVTYLSVQKPGYVNCYKINDQFKVKEIKEPGISFRKYLRVDKNGNQIEDIEVDRKYPFHWVDTLKQVRNGEKCYFFFNERDRLGKSMGGHLKCIKKDKEDKLWVFHNQSKVYVMYFRKNGQNYKTPCIVPSVPLVNLLNQNTDSLPRWEIATIYNIW